MLASCDIADMQRRTGRFRLLVVVQEASSRCLPQTQHLLGQRARQYCSSLPPLQGCKAMCSNRDLDEHQWEEGAWPLLSGSPGHLCATKTSQAVQQG